MTQEQLKAEEARLKEQARLEKEPFKTIAEPREEVLNELRGWKPPARNTAYILFESKHYFLNKEAWGYGLHTLNVEARPDQTEKIKYYLSKGYRIIHFDNFPKTNDPNPERAKQARMHTNESGVNSYDILERLCKSQITGEKQESAKIRSLEQKLAELEKKESLKNQKGKTDESKDAK